MTPIQSLLGFAAWTLLLVLVVFLYRGLRFLGGTPINHWPRGNKPADDAPWFSAWKTRTPIAWKTCRSSR